MADEPKAPYGYEYTVRRWRTVKCETLASIYAEAAQQLEAHPEYDDPLYAIRKATEARGMDDGLATYAWMHFRGCTGAWNGGDESIVLLCFASAMAATGDL